MSYLEVEHATKCFGEVPVLKDLSFAVEKGQTLSILGKSGCGKTTLLKALAGLLTLDKGDVVLDGINMNSVNPAKRGIVYLYQETLLFPHLNVMSNIAFGLEIKKQEKKQIRQKCEEMIHQLGLEGHENKMPDELSGGQKQRVAFGRAIITDPAVILLDEPFGNLDAQIRSEMQVFFKEKVSDFGTTTLFVTHDLKEALKVGDQMAFMDEGKLKTYASQVDFLNDPITGASEELAFWQDLKNKKEN